MILDIHSRYAVGWMLAARESAVVAEAHRRDLRQAGHHSRPAHDPRGPRLLDDFQAGRVPARRLRVTQSHSRPHVSNDNPFSEAQFKTLKYRPYFPGRSTSIEHAQAHCQEFFRWYNDEHRHSGLGLHTAADVHHGQAAAVQNARADVLGAAYCQHPERFVRKPPAPPALPGASWINPPQEKEAATQ